MLRFNVALGSIPSPPSPILLSLGPLTVRWYALWILLGMGIAIVWSAKRWQKRGGNPDFVMDVGFWACILGIVGARVMSVISYPEQYFAEGVPWWKPFAIWQGGLAIYGGLIFGTLTVVVMVRLNRLPVLVFLDAAAPTVLLAQVLGRLGNYFNQEVFGKETTLPWGLEISSQNLPDGAVPGTLFHPTFLYEMLWNLLALGAILLYERFRVKTGSLYAGELSAMYFLYYSLGRFLLEFVRIDFQNTVIWNMRWFQLVALVGIIVGVVWWSWAKYAENSWNIEKPALQVTTGESVQS